MKYLLLILLLVQVGPNLWVAPNSVAAVKWVPTYAVSYVFLNTGERIESDWRLDRILEALKK